MPVLVIKEFPAVDPDVLAIGHQMNVYDPAPDGLVAHIATRTDSGMQVVDIWESREDYDRFSAEVHGPRVRKVAADLGIELRVQPTVTVTEGVDFARGR
jgi:hypothetical protein